MSHMAATLRLGSHVPEVALVKYRLDELRRKIFIAASPAGSVSTWGPSHPENPYYDVIMVWNVAAFQTFVNRYWSGEAAPGNKPMKVDGLYGDATRWCLTVAEQWVDDYLRRNAHIPHH